MRWSCYFLIVFLRVFPEKEKERKGRSAEGRRRLSNSPFSSLRASSPGCSSGVAGKGNSNPYPKPPSLSRPSARAPRGACSQANRSRSKREKGNGNVVIFLANLFPWVLKALRVPTLTELLLCSCCFVLPGIKKVCWTCNQEKKACFWISNTRLAFQTSKTLIYRPLTPELTSISKFQLLFHWRNVEKYMIFYTVPWSRWNRTHTLWNVRCIVGDSGIRSNVLKQQPH